MLHWARELVHALSQGRRPYNAVERAARDATGDEPWGPHGQLLQVRSKNASL